MNGDDGELDVCIGESSDIKGHLQEKEYEEKEDNKTGTVIESKTTNGGGKTAD